jgi:methylmalonyl-CoA mutase N-terminal domain/subunit
MDEGKTTKQILEEKSGAHQRSSIYNPESTMGLVKAFDEWRSTAESEDVRVNWHATPHVVLGSEIPRGLLYTPIDVAGLDYEKDLGFPGEEPYARGIHANMYRGKEFTIRQLSGFAGPEETNERIKFLLLNGATGMNIVFDLPTIQEYDSDDRMARGQVGMGGVAIDSVEDMAILFEGIPIDKISVSLVTHYPTNTAILFAMYLAMAERRGISWKNLTGSVQNDVVMEEVVRGAPDFIPPKDCFRIQCDNMAFIREHVPRWNCITLNGYNLREAGTSAVTETSVAMANAIASLNEMVARGHSADWVAERITFFWDVSNDFFGEVARLRAARRLWYRIMKHRFGAGSARSMLMRCHVQTSGLCLPREEPMNNIVRAAYHALAAVLGGTQSLHVDSYDECYSVPTEAASLVSLRTQQIIQEETAVTAVVDPLGGSFYVESLTNEIERRVLDELDEVEAIGGIVAAIEKGWLHRKISDYARSEHEMIEQAKIKIVGHNCLKATTTKVPEIDIFRYPGDIADRQRQKLLRLRSERDRVRVEESLRALQEACKERQNVFPYCLEAARANATEGEIAKVFRDVYGLWSPPMLC